MPIEIREILIRARIESPAPPPKNEAAMEPEDLARETRRLVRQELDKLRTRGKASQRAPFYSR